MRDIVGLILNNCQWNTWNRMDSALVAVWMLLIIDFSNFIHFSYQDSQKKFCGTPLLFWGGINQISMLFLCLFVEELCKFDLFWFSPLQWGTWFRKLAKSKLAYWFISYSVPTKFLGLGQFSCFDGVAES